MSGHLEALRSSAMLLRELVEPLDDTQVELAAYPAEWTIADVLSHIGSGAVILQRRLDDGLAGLSTPDEFAPGVWDVWNAKAPRAKADDGLLADAALVERLDSVSDTERAGFRTSLGPMTFDFTGLVALRLNEHVLHTWDIRVARDPSAVLPPDATALVVDSLDLIARFTGKPTGRARTFTVETDEPSRTFIIDLAPDAVTFTSAASDREPDLRVSSEAFIRLVYGRLDPDHTPAIQGDPDVLDELRLVFPGP